MSAPEAGCFLTEVNAAFPWLALTQDDVTLVHRGVVPAKHAPGRPIELLDTPEIRDHARDGVEGAISVVGVKFTTARGVAERAITMVCRKLGRGSPRSDTGSRPLIEPASHDVQAVSLPFAPASLERIRRLYGQASERLLGLVAERRALAEPVEADTNVTGAEVIHAIREESALTLEDVVVRRTGLGALGYPGDPCVARCASLMAGELEWTAERTADEQAAVRQFYEIGSPSARRDAVGVSER